MFAAETGRFRLGAVATGPPRPVPVVRVRVDTLAARLATTSPIDPTAIGWVQAPTYCYGAGGGAGPRGAAGCVGGRRRRGCRCRWRSSRSTTPTGPRTRRFTPPTDALGRRSGIYAVPGRSWASTGPGPALTGVRAGSGEDAEVWLTFKGTDGSLVKTAWRVGHTAGGRVTLTRADADTAGSGAAAGHPGLLLGRRDGRGPRRPVRRDPRTWGSRVLPAAADLDAQAEESLVAGRRSTGRAGRPVHGYFGVGYRGWSVAGYRADGRPPRARRWSQADFDLVPAGTGLRQRRRRVTVQGVRVGARRRPLPGLRAADPRDPPDRPDQRRRWWLRPGRGAGPAPDAYLFTPQLTAPPGPGRPAPLMVSVSWVGPRAASSTSPRSPWGAGRLAERARDPRSPTATRRGRGRRGWWRRSGWDRSPRTWGWRAGWGR